MLVRYEEFGNRNAKFQFFSKITDISRSWTDFEFTVIPGVEVQNITLKTSIMVLVRTLGGYVIELPSFKLGPKAFEENRSSTLSNFFHHCVTPQNS